MTVHTHRHVCGWCCFVCYALALHLLIHVTGMSYLPTDHWDVKIKTHNDLAECQDMFERYLEEYSRVLCGQKVASVEPSGQTLFPGAWSRGFLPLIDTFLPIVGSDE